MPRILFQFKKCLYFTVFKLFENLPQVWQLCLKKSVVRTHWCQPVRLNESLFKKINQNIFEFQSRISGSDFVIFDKDGT